jgi:hypothetical protein
MAKVKPLYKKGDRYDIKNYRPMSLISVFAKLLERLMFNRMISFLSQNKLFTEVQNGFRKGKCIDTAIQSFIEVVQESLDKGLHTIGIFIDLTKAYDILNHILLLDKLSFYGIRGTVNSWFKSYLTDRRQFIEIKQSDSSNVREIKHSVPQGSVLGLLFLLYINDLLSNIHCTKLVMFADDINVLITDRDEGMHQSKVFTELESWFNRNSLVINVDKTAVMSFHNKQSKILVKPKITLNKINLVYTAETKFLGIYITETLRWNSHVQLLATKLSTVSYMIKSLRETLSHYMIQNIYFTKFAIPFKVWYTILGGNGGEVNVRIFRIQKRVIRLMVGVSSRTSCGQLFKEMNVLTLTLLYILELTCFIRKYCQYLELNSHVHNHNTRRKMDIHVQSYKADIYKKSIVNMGTKVYNELPSYIKEIDNYKAFKKELKLFLLCHTFYSVEEFIVL